MYHVNNLSIDEKVEKEYKKAFLLNLFQKLCIKMNKNVDIKKRIQTLYRQSYNKIETTKLIVKRELDCNLSIDDATLFCSWIFANLRKSNTRKTLSLELKKSLYEKQNGICPICGKKLGLAWDKIHIDHIIPFKLVGDELENNYQDLCETCNECKSTRTDYLFKKLLKLN